MEQIKARKILRDNKQYLTRQQIRTIDGQIKSGNVDGAMRGLQKILDRKKGGDSDASRKTEKGN